MKKIMSVVLVMAMALVFGMTPAFAGNGNGNNGNGSNWKCTPETNLFIQDVVVLDKTGKEFKAQEDLLIPGETYFVYVYPEIDRANPGNGLAKGRDKVDTELYVFLGLDSTSVDDADWDLVGKVRTKVQILNDNQWEKGLISFTVPAEAAGYRAYLKAIVDSFKEICETNEEDNLSDWATFWFPIKGEPDFAKTTIGLTTGALSITEGDKYDVTMKLESKGHTPHAKDFLSGFFLKGPDDFNWKLLETNLTLAKDTMPGTVLWKKTGQYTAGKPGTIQIMGCADNVDTVEELLENNNCFSGSFLVKAKPAPANVDLIVWTLKLTEGTSVGKGKFFHPRAYPKNIGKVFPNADSVTRFEFSGPGTGGQWKKCAERSQTVKDYYPLRLFIAQVDDNVCQMPNVAGAYTVRACVDANGSVSETNEANNCKQIAVTVK